MKKKLIRLTEQDLNRIIMGSVNKVLKEGCTRSDVISMFYRAVGMMGADYILNALISFLDEDTIVKFVETLKREYELPLDEC